MFNCLLENELPPMKPVMYIFPEEEISKQKEDFRELIEFFFAKYDNEYQLNIYLSGFAEFEIIDGMESEIITNTEHIKYRQTLEKRNF